MNIYHHYSLQSFNTFGIKVSADTFVNITSVDDLRTILCQQEYKTPFILGGGSNVLFTQDVGCVFKNNIGGIEVVKESEQDIYIKAGAGVEWQSLVEYCLQYNYAGIENLSYIPGSVGAAPIQNIGAYGVELKDIFFELEALHLRTGKIETFKKADCEFGYRNSIFKTSLKEQYIITSVTLQLSKNHGFHLSYPAIEKELNDMEIKTISLKTVSQAIGNIRSRKLPDPKIIGNAGSFFKNPIISNALWENLQNKYVDIVGYKETENTTKVAAGWLIEKAGWKGKQLVNCGVYDKQALVLVNYGNATGKEILHLSQDIQQSVMELFGIELEREVNVY